MNLYRVGHINRFLLTYLYRQIKVKPERWYLFVDEREDYERIRDRLLEELGDKSLKEIGRRNILEVYNEKEDLFNIGLGIPLEIMRSLEENGYKIYPNFKNSHRINEDIIRSKFDSIKTITNIDTVLFSGKSVLGFPNLIDEVSERMKQNNYSFGIVEFVNQLGDLELAKLLPASIVRVHTIPQKTMAKMTKEKAAKRFVRSVKERGIKLLLLPLFNKEIHQSKLITYNIEFLNIINSDLKELNYKTTTNIPLKVNPVHKPQQIKLFILGCGIVASLILLLNYFFTINLLPVLGYFTCYFAMFYWFSIIHNLGLLEKSLALIAAITFPVIAMVSQFPKQVINRNKWQIYGLSIWYIIKQVAICLIGASLIIGVLSSNQYLFYLDKFRGVKVAFIVPMILVAFYFYLRPHRIKSIFYVFKRLFYAPLRSVSLISFILCSIFIIVLILRSGNYMIPYIPLLDAPIRESVESFFTIRPRTKEFLIGYPFLLLTFIYVDREWNRNSVWFFNVLGSVALISIINSFCHIHTPLIISLLRVVIGIGFGICMGAFYMLAYKVIKRLLAALHL